MLEKLKNKGYTYDTRNRGKKTTSESRCEIDTSEWNRLVAEAAYYLAEKRGFAPGHEMEDWLTAESQVREMLRKTRR